MPPPTTALWDGWQMPIKGSLHWCRPVSGPRDHIPKIAGLRVQLPQPSWSHPTDDLPPGGPFARATTFRTSASPHPVPEAKISLSPASTSPLHLCIPDEPAKFPSREPQTPRVLITHIRVSWSVCLKCRVLGPPPELGPRNLCFQPALCLLPFCSQGVWNLWFCSRSWGNGKKHSSHSFLMSLKQLRKKRKKDTN